jgi:hypothetical protein
MTDSESGGFGEPGRSARREYERRRQRREVSKRHWVVGLLRDLLGLSRTERRRLARDERWADGAEGEELLAAELARRCPLVLMLHDRRLPGTRANIDHVAVAASGVYVIDTKRYKGKIEVHSPLFGQAKLKIAGRDRTNLIDGLDGQVAAVRAALVDMGSDIPVHGALCFVAPKGRFADVGLPVLRTLNIRGYALYYARRLAKRLNGPGPLSPEFARIVHAELAKRLPAA